MSRIGKQPVEIPAKVKVAIDGDTIKVNGPLGELERTLELVTIKQEANTLTLEPIDGSREASSRWGLMRTLVANMVNGVSEGFTQILDINGVGYRAEVSGSTLTLAVGKSHPEIFELPNGVTATVEKQVVLTLKGPDKDVVGQLAAKIRDCRPPEPYKGKGIKYREETIRRKAGKAAK